MPRGSRKTRNGKRPRAKDTDGQTLGAVLQSSGVWLPRRRKAGEPARKVCLGAWRFPNPREFPTVARQRKGHSGPACSAPVSVGGSELHACAHVNIL